MASSPSVLTISSQVAAGPVGNSAIVPGLLSLGVTPAAVPTIVLSNHPGHGTPAGAAIEATELDAMLRRLLELGFLDNCRVVLTGYFASADQVGVVATFISTLRTHLSGLFYLCDPVLGDDDALYVKAEIAVAIRDRLAPLADALLPNAFELAWLSGRSVSDLESAARAAATWPDKQVIGTSIAAGASQLATALFGPSGTAILTRPLLADVPHGTGDLLSGLIAGHRANGKSIEDCLPLAVAEVERAIALSNGTALDLARWLRP